jgi:hypothetical protein
VSKNDRPGGVTLVVVLGYLSGLASILGGVLIGLNRRNHEVHKSSGMSSHEVAIYGGALIVIGVVVLIVVRALGQGRDWARIVVGVVMLLRIAGGVIELIKLPTLYRSGAVFEILLAGLIFYLVMISRKDRAFFGMK